MGHVCVLTNWLDFGLDLQEAIDAPRFMPGGGVVALERPVPQEVLKALQQRGHVVGRTELALGGAQAIYVDAKNGVLWPVPTRARTVARWDIKEGEICMNSQPQRRRVRRDKSNN